MSYTVNNLSSSLLEIGGVMVKPYAQGVIVPNEGATDVARLAAQNLITWTGDGTPATLGEYGVQKKLEDPLRQVALLRPSLLESLEYANTKNLLSPRSSSSLAGLTSWWPLQEGTGTQVNDAVNPGLTGTIQGTTGGVWANGASEGVVFNGTDVQIAINPNPASNLLREILNLSTLGANDQLLIWFVLTHPTTIANAGIICWGLEGTAGVNAAYEGFSIATLASNNFLQWRDRAPGATAFTQTGLTNPSNVASLAGSQGGNTKSAVCLAIEHNSQENYYEITVSRANITQLGGIGQTDGGIFTVPALPLSATGRTRYNAAAGLTLGAIAKTGQSATGDYGVRTPASHALRNVGFQRRTASGGIAMRMVRDLAKSPTTLPLSARNV